jgi:hypothetical protein
VFQVQAVLVYTNQQWTARKRYNDFKKLHAGLSKAGGLALALPAKEPVEGWDAALATQPPVPQAATLTPVEQQQQAQLEWRRCSLDGFLCRLVGMAGGLAEPQQQILQGAQLHTILN